MPARRFAGTSLRSRGRCRPSHDRSSHVWCLAPDVAGGATAGGDTGPDPGRRVLLDELEARARAVGAADLGRLAAVGEDDVAGEVVLAADQGRADAVGVDRD